MTCRSNKRLNKLVFIADSKTPTGVAERQMEVVGPGPWLIPSSKSTTGYQTNFNKTQRGGVADEWLTQLVRKTDAKVFKEYSQMKLQMKREALAKLNRQGRFDTVLPNRWGFDRVLIRF